MQCNSRQGSMPQQNGGGGAMAVVLCSAMSKEGRGIFLTHFVMSHFMGRLLWPACKGGPIFL